MEQPPKDSAIVVDTLPEMILGKTLQLMPGLRLTFFKENELRYFQATPIFHVMEPDATQLSGKIYQFRVATNFEIGGIKIEDKGFYESMFSYISTAIANFNWYLQRHKSYLVKGKSYPTNISTEQNKEAIKKAYMIKDFGLPSNN